MSENIFDRVIFTKNDEVTIDSINYSKEARELLDEVKVDYNEELFPPQTCIEMSGSAICTLGNFSLIIGKAKSRKSFFLVVAVSAALNDELVLERFIGKMPSDQQKVLYFDTEQSKYHVQKAAHRICEMLGNKNPINLEVYGLRKYKPEQRLSLIEYAINNTNNIGLIVIDGVRDLVTSINDEEQATGIASCLLKWTEEKNIHIISVLHQNKSDNNARGHLGSELVNKAETVLSVTKDESTKEISIVQAEYCRDKEPDSFAFEISNDSLPVVVSDWEIKKKDPGKITISDIEEFKKFELLNIVYSKGDEFKYTELRIQLKLALVELLNISIGDNKVKELITYCKNKKWLLQETRNGAYKLGQYQVV